MSHREVLVASTADALAESVAGMLASAIVRRQEAAGVASVVVTGGGIGTAVLAALRDSAAADAVDWSAIDLWWGDERFLPTGDQERNETAAQATLLSHLPVDPARVHPIAGPDRALDAEDAAGQYAAHLARHATSVDHGPVPTFDVVLLGIGPDAHVASLFPEHPALHDRERMVVAVHGSPKPPPTRVSLTLPAINAGREVWVLASGASKANAVRLALDPAAGPMQVPAAGVHGRERTCFLLDRAAAAHLPADLPRPIA